MPPTAAFGFEQLVTELLRGLIEAVADRPGESEAQRFARHQTAVFSAMAFMPRDAVETMLASQCVMLDNLLRDGTRDLLLGQSEQVKLRVRPQLTAMGRQFLKHLEQLIRFQARPVEQIAVLPNAKTEPLPEAAEKAAQSANCETAPVPSQSPSAVNRADSVAGQPTPSVSEPCVPSNTRPASTDTAPPSQPPSATTERPSAASHPSVTSKSDLILRRGFQNRRARRAAEFKKSVGHSRPVASTRVLGKPAVTPPADAVAART